MEKERIEDKMPIKENEVKLGSNPAFDYADIGADGRRIKDSGSADQVHDHGKSNMIKDSYDKVKKNTNNPSGLGANNDNRIKNDAQELADQQVQHKIQEIMKNKKDEEILDGSAEDDSRPNYQGEVDNNLFDINQNRKSEMDDNHSNLKDLSKEPIRNDGSNPKRVMEAELRRHFNKQNGIEDPRNIPINVDYSNNQVLIS
eukprot:NODE_371_length_9954_cov_0.100355.p6 type:complete len:201 gc:universal NODE_371_length_9954_cov_0.100355:2540-3142(+)